MNNFHIDSANVRIFAWTLIIAAFVWYLINFYRRVARLPNGPFPLPFIGNLPYIVEGLFINKNRNPNYGLFELEEKYGPVYTLWILNKPFVVVADLDLLKDCFIHNKNSGREMVTYLETVTDGEGFAIIFEDVGPEWSSLRKTAHNAVRKFVTSDCLPIFVNDSVTKLIAQIKCHNGQPIDIYYYVSSTLINVVASISFGKSYDYDDPEFVNISKLFKMMSSQVDFMFFADTFPRIIKPIFMYFFGRKSQFGFSNLAKMCRLKLNEHHLNYKDGVIRDFADSLIAAKNKAVEEEKESKDHLNDYNLGNAIFDLFFAGVDTSDHVLTWSFLFMTKYPEMQVKMRQEIAKVVGDRLPVQEDKDQCHYLMAFVAEAIRMRSMPTFGIPHKTMAQSKIGNHVIPANTNIGGHLFSIMTSEKYWINGNVFDPERFLDSDSHFTGMSQDKPAAFIPFGVGRRVCIGERLAWVDLFLIMANVFRLTQGYVFEFDGRPEDADVDLDPKVLFNCEPKPFRVKLVKQT